MSELSRKVALLCGWRFHRSYGNSHFYFPPGSRESDLPIECLEFAESLDACFGPGGPVEVAKANDWDFALQYNPSTNLWFAGFAENDTSAQEPARALCLAFVAAMEA